MERLSAMVEAKRILAERYLHAFSDFPWASIYREPKGSLSNYWLNTLVLDREHAAERDRLLAALHGHGIRARPLWTPMHFLPMYRDCPHSPLPVAEDIHARCINLPSSPFLAESTNKI
jgi:perosamine synthetase